MKITDNDEKTFQAPSIDPYETPLHHSYICDVQLKRKSSFV